jgi:hypothetical protein
VNARPFSALELALCWTMRNRTSRLRGRSILLGVLIPTLLLVVSAGPAGAVDNMFDCGVILEDPVTSCMVFRTSTASTYVFDGIDSFAPGDTLFCSGSVDSSCTQPCSGHYPCIQGPFTCPCSYRDLGCGRLTVDYGDRCDSFDSATYPGMMLMTWGGFGDGDSVRVKGWVSCSPPICSGLTTVLVDSIYRCGTLVPSSGPSWGQIKALFR